MSIEEWIHIREQKGQTTFSIEDTKNTFLDLTAGTIKTSLYRLVRSGRIQSVYRGFYVVIPIQYQLKGVVPVEYYVDDMMQWLQKPYYVCLLSAAAIYGASHQRAMKTQVMTILPKTRPNAKNKLLSLYYRHNIESSLLTQQNGEMGIIKYSSPELTAADLIQYADHIGGYQRAATVLAELIEVVDMNKMDSVLDVSTTATLQRLGYITEYILEDIEKANQLFNILNTRNVVRKSILLSNKHPKNIQVASNRWHVNANIDIEIDDL